jgi:hypothetical protein
VEGATMKPLLKKLRIDGFVIVAACAPAVGVVMAVSSKEPAWLFLCFALALFL